MRVLSNSLSGVAVAGGRRIGRGGWSLCLIVVVVLLGGFARRAHAGKQFVYVMGASCQAESLIFAVSPVTYTDTGVVYQGPNSTDVVCPITWAKPAVPTGQIVGELDIQVDWRLGPGQQPGGCELIYQTPAGFFVQSLPIPYPVPATMTNMKYAAVDCTIPSFAGVNGISFNVCTTTPGAPGACPAP